MGYYTWYELEILKTGRNYPEESVPNIIKWIKEKIEKEHKFDPYEFSIGDIDDTENCNDTFFSPDDTCKWYDYSQEMLEMSNHFKHTLFLLHGEGEEHNDVWRAFYYGGNQEGQRARIVFDEFDAEEWMKSIEEEQEVPHDNTN